MGTPSAKTRQKNVVLWRSSPSVLRWLKIRWFMAEQFELSNKHHLRAVVLRLTLLIGREAARRGNNGNGWHAVRT
jgi:hypothetical protein